MNKTMEEVDEETRLHRRREMQRNHLKLKREQLTNLFSSHLNDYSLKHRKYHFGMAIRIAGNGEVVLSRVLPFVK